MSVMTWYAAHVILSIHPQKRGAPITLHENVILIEAKDAESAKKIAEDIAGKSVAGYAGLEIDGVSTICNFEGVKKVINVSNPFPLDQDEDRPVSGTEITYTEFQARDSKDVKEFIRGMEVSLKYIE